MPDKKRTPYLWHPAFSRKAVTHADYKMMKVLEAETVAAPKSPYTA